MDRLLDHARTGPLYLARPEIASIVVQAIVDGRDHLHHYSLHAFVVMPNHVHLLITPQAPVPKLLQWLKGTTARRVNQILRLTGRAFWQEESYDRWVRHERQFGRLRCHAGLFRHTSRRIRCGLGWPGRRRITCGPAHRGALDGEPG